jgi:hypothetical protein
MNVCPCNLSSVFYLKFCFVQLVFLPLVRGLFGFCWPCLCRSCWSMSLYRSEHCIVGYMQPFLFGFWEYGCELLFDSSFHSCLLQWAMQLVQLFEPDMSQVLYILCQWQLLVDFTLVYVEVLHCDYYLFGSLGDSIYKKTIHTQRMTLKEISGVDFQHCLTFMGPCIINVFFKYNQQDAMLYNILYYCQCSTCFRQFLRPSSGVQKLHTASGICEACLLLPLAWVRWLSHASGSSKQAWHIPDAVYTVFELLMMGWETAWNM